MSNGWRAVGVVAAAAAMSAAAIAAGRLAEEAHPTPGPGFGPGPVTQATAVTGVWEAVDATLEPGLDPTSDNPCRSGQPTCLDVVVEEMAARLGRSPCAHTAPFAFTYLEMTRGVQRRVGEDGFFGNRAALAHLDALFAELYFDAFDNWKAGRHEEVPGAWQMAFAAADGRRVSAAGDLLLGMNAHISRDLAYTVAYVLETAPELADDPADFLLVNEVIGEVRGPMLAAAAERFDPSLGELDPAAAGAEDVDAVALIGQWRQVAFDLGRRLAEAPTEAERDAVSAEIERNAVAAATVILNADAVTPFGMDAKERLAYCDR